MLDRFKTQYCSLLSISMHCSFKLKKQMNIKLIDPKLYRLFIRCLLFATIIIRVDINYAIENVCKYMQKPKEVYSIVAKHILLYFKGIRN